MGAAPSEPRSVRVVLAFDADFDLDLYVTGPREEAVYFANPHSAIGGRLREDARCDGAARGVRFEEVVFPDAPPGRYRVGVDHMRTCRGSARPAAFAVAFLHGGEATFAEGSVPPLFFEVVVLERRVPAR